MKMHELTPEFVRHEMVRRELGQRRNHLSRSLLDISRPHPAATGIETPRPFKTHHGTARANA